MAKQTGILPLEGTIGNVTFYKSKAGYLVGKRAAWMVTVLRQIRRLKGRG